MLLGAKTTLGDGVDRNDLRVPHVVPVPGVPALGRHAVEAEPQAAGSRQLEWKHRVEGSCVRLLTPGTISMSCRDHRRRRGNGRASPTGVTCQPQPRRVRRLTLDGRARHAAAPRTSREDLRSAASPTMEARLAKQSARRRARRSCWRDALLRQTRITGNPGLAFEAEQVAERACSTRRSRELRRQPDARRAVPVAAPLPRSHRASPRRIARRGRTIRSTTASSATATSSSATTSRRSTRSIG